MKTSEEMAQSVIQRARVHRAAKKRRIITVTAAFLCVCGISLAALATGITPDPVPDTLQVQPTTEATEATDAIIKTTSTRIALMNCTADGTLTTEMEKDVKVPYQMELRVRDIRGLTEDEVEAIQKAEKKYANDLIDAAPDDLGEWAWGCYTNKNGIVTTISAGHFFLQIDDPDLIESIRVTLSGDGVLFHISSTENEDSETTPGEYFLDTKTIKRQYRSGGLNMVWVLSSENCNKLATDPSIPLSTFHDTITMTVTMKNGTQQVYVIDIEIEDNGDVFAIYRGDTAAD